MDDLEASFVYIVGNKPYLHVCSLEAAHSF